MAPRSSVVAVWGGEKCPAPMRNRTTIRRSSRRSSTLCLKINRLPFGIHRLPCKEQPVNALQGNSCSSQHTECVNTLWGQNALVCMMLKVVHIVTADCKFQTTGQAVAFFVLSPIYCHPNHNTASFDTLSEETTNPISKKVLDHRTGWERPR